MTSIGSGDCYDYYSNLIDASVSTRKALYSIQQANTEIALALSVVKATYGNGSAKISPVSEVTTNDVHRNLLFLQLLLRQIDGLTQSHELQQLLELTSGYEVNNEEEF